MQKQLQGIFLLSTIIFALAFVLPSCKKEDKYPSQSLPNIITVNPTSAIPGSPVEIKGSNLKSITDVKFGTTDAVFDASSSTDTAITVIVPDSLPPGDLYVQVYVGDGVAYAAQKFTILEAPKIPTIASVDPETAFPGDNITIKGINFSAVSSITFGTTPAVYTIADSTKLTVTIPNNLTGSNQIITVSAPTGSDTISFVVNFAPVITSFSPGQAHEGDLITVSGKRFTGVTSVTLGSLSTTFNVANDSTLTFTVPSGAISGNVSVTTSNGSVTSTGSLVVSVAGFKLIVYDDALATGFSAWGGWGGDPNDPINYSNTSPVETGTQSIKMHYLGQWVSPMQIGVSSIDLTKYTTFKISIYGGPGTDGRSFNIGFNKTNDPGDYSTADGKTITISEGKWTDFEIPISDITSSTGITTLTQIILKEYSNIGSVNEIIYVDNMGFN